VLPSLTVVIPTRDRAARLRATLEALDEQAPEGGAVEVVVVDDGSSDETVELLGDLRVERLALRVIESGGRGPAAARNLAVREATAPRVLLLGDDTRPAPGALDVHLRAPDAIGVQGRIEWDPALELTPVMRFLAPEGPQFYFKGLRGGERLPYWRVLGSNLSAPTAWFHEEPFDEAFRHAAFEDTELAYRWQRRGFRVVYSATAVCWHDHPYDSLDPFLAKQRQAGRAARLAMRRHPALAGRVLVHPVAFGLAVAGRLGLGRLAGRARREDAWDLRVRLAFLRGLLSRSGAVLP
jgi:glycosyltransferase involved in cell wall biosynthesis